MTIRASTIVTAFAFGGFRGRSHLGERVTEDLPLSRCEMKCMDPVAISWLQDDAEGARLQAGGHFPLSNKCAHFPNH